MGVRILSDIDTGACMYDSVTMKAFGPVFADEDDVGAFLKLMFPGNADPRLLTDSELDAKHVEYHENRMQCDSCGEYGLKDGDVPEDWNHINDELLCNECTQLYDEGLEDELSKKENNQ